MSADLRDISVFYKKQIQSKYKYTKELEWKCSKKNLFRTFFNI